MEEVKEIKKGKSSSSVSLSTAHQQGSLTVRQLNLTVRPS